MEKIKELRIKKQLTQVEFAEAIGIKSNSAISMWENGKRFPRTQYLKRIAKALDVSVDDLLD